MRTILAIALILNAFIGISQNEPNISTSKTGISYELDAGFGFTALSNNFAYNSFYLSPYINKPINSKFSLQAGMAFQNISLFGKSSENSLMPKNINTISYFAQGSIQQTEKLLLFGGINHTREMNFGDFKSPNFQSNSIYGGFNYRISKNTTIGAAIRYSQGNNHIFNNDNFLMPRQNTTNNFSPFLW